MGKRWTGDTAAYDDFGRMRLQVTRVRTDPNLEKGKAETTFLRIWGAEQRRTRV